MPRIRYLKRQLKDVEPITIEEVEPEDDGRGEDEFQTQTMGSSVQERTILESGGWWSSPEELRTGSPRGWWSSPTVIASLPASKIKQAIRYHKDMLHILQCELLSRTNDNPRISYPDYEFLPEHFEQDFAKQSYRSKREIKKAKRNRVESKTTQFCKILEQAKLPPAVIAEMVLKLVNALNKKPKGA